MVRNSLVLLTTVAALMLGCQEGTDSFGMSPPAPEFVFDDRDPNNVVFAVAKADGGFMVNWDFGNGYLSQNIIDTVYYPFAGTYTVSLAVSGKGGSTVTKKQITIKATDPKICADPYYELLSGGCNAERKIWMVPNIDAALANGPPSATDSLGNGTSTYDDKISFWWSSALANNIPDTRTLDDEYVFGLKGFTYLNDCHGHFYFNYKWANELFGATQGQYADTIYTYTPSNPATWELDRVAEKDTTGGKKAYFTDSATGERFNLVLKFSNDNYIGYCSGVSVYQILEISADSMYLRHELGEPDDPSVTGQNRLEWRYLRLVAKK